MHVNIAGFDQQSSFTFARKEEVRREQEAERDRRGRDGSVREKEGARKGEQKESSFHELQSQR